MQIAFLPFAFLSSNACPRGNEAMSNFHSFNVNDTNAIIVAFRRVFLQFGRSGHKKLLKVD